MTPPKFENVIQPKRFATKVPRQAKKKAGRWKTSLVYGDRHGAFSDPRAEAVVFAAIKDIRPDVIINVGDDVDCYAISRFDKNPNRKMSLQDEIDNTAAHLHAVAELAPESERWLLEGNHEDRLRKLIWKLPGAAQELAKLKVFQDNMTWRVLLDLNSVGFTFVPTTEQSHTEILPKIIVKHGSTVAPSSAASAQREWTKYGKSGISGHTHRLGTFYHRDHNGTHVWHESGCICSLVPEYDPDPDWHQGFLVVQHDTKSERFSIQEVYIQDGVAIYNGQIYEG